LQIDLEMIAGLRLRYAAKSGICSLLLITPLVVVGVDDVPGDGASQKPRSGLAPRKSLASQMQLTIFARDVAKGPPSGACCLLPAPENNHRQE